MERTNIYFKFIYLKNTFISINKNLNNYLCNSIPNSYTANIVKMQKQPANIKYTGVRYIKNLQYEPASGACH